VDFQSYYRLQLIFHTITLMFTLKKFKKSSKIIIFNV